MSKFGKLAIRSLKEFLADARAGKPMEQHVLRRMWVKGKPVIVRDTFKAPVGKPL